MDTIANQPSEHQGAAVAVGSGPLSGVFVWLVREQVTALSDPARKTEQDCFVVAATATEAVDIVGETDWRKIVAVQQACPITRVPGDKYQVVRRSPNIQVSHTAGK